MKSADQQPQTRKGKSPGFARELADFGRALRSLLDPYRPEQHYMRGPGPKWHAKHAPPPATVVASQLPASIPVNG